MQDYSFIPVSKLRPDWHQDFKPIQKTAPQSQGRHGITGWLPAIGATAAGLAAAPFTGGASLAATLAILGGSAAAGSALGELGAEKANKEKVNLGSIGKQAAIGGALGAIPLGGLGKAARVAKRAESGLPTTATGKILGKVQSSGVRMQTRASGIGLGEKLTGQEAVNPQTQAKLLQTMKAEKIPAGHPDIQLRAISGKLDNYHKQMEQALIKSDRSLSLAERKSIRNTYLRAVKASPTVDTNTLKYAEQFGNNLMRQAKTKTGLTAFRRGVDKNAINYIANPDAAVAAKQEAAQILRTHLSKTIGRLAPEVKTINGKYSNLSKLGDFATAQSGRATRMSESGGGGLFATLKTGDTAQSLKSVVGTKLASAPTANTAGGKVASLGIRDLAKQAGGRSLINSQSPQPTPTTDLTSALGGLSRGADTLSPPTQTTAQSPYPLEQALADIQRDPKHIADYTNLFKTVSAATAPTKISAAQEKNNADLSIAGSGLKSIAQAYQFAGGGKGAPGIATHIPLVGQYIAPKAAAYNQTRIEVATQLAKALTGSSRPAQQVIFYYLHSLPNIEDRPEVAQNKLAILNNELQNRTASSQRAYDTGTADVSSSDLMSTLQDLQGQGGY